MTFKYTAEEEEGEEEEEQEEQVYCSQIRRQQVD